MKYCVKILESALRLSICHMMEGRVKMLETKPQSEGIISVYPINFMHLQTFIVIILSRTTMLVCDTL